MDEARRAGFDLNLIEINLSLTPAERWRQHDMALEVILELEEARMARDATPATSGYRQQYDVAADGRVLINETTEDASASPITLLLNWKPQTK
jgi:hypothetical protein